MSKLEAAAILCGLLTLAMAWVLLTVVGIVLIVAGGIGNVFTGIVVLFLVATATLLALTEYREGR